MEEPKFQMMTEDEIAAHKEGAARLRAEIRAKRAASERREREKRDGSRGVAPNDGSPKGGSGSKPESGSSQVGEEREETAAAAWMKMLGCLWVWLVWLLSYRLVLLPLCLFFVSPFLATLHGTVCSKLQSNTPKLSLPSVASDLAFNVLCKRQPPAPVHASYEISSTPVVARYGEALPQLAAWASHNTDFTPLAPADAARLASFESSVRAALTSVAGTQRDALNIVRDINSRPAGPLRWWNRMGISNGPAGAARDRISRLKVVLETALDTFENLVAGVSPGAIEQTFKPMSATCGWRRALYKKEQTLREEVKSLAGGSREEEEEAAPEVAKALAVAESQSAVAQIACRATEATTEQLRGLRGRLQRGSVPTMAELVRAAQRLEADARDKGGWATEVDVVRWEEEVVGLAMEFEKVVARAWDGWNLEI